MPRDRATTPPPPTDREAWLSAFVDELQRLRPHMSLKLASTVGRQAFRTGVDPKATAAAYHARQEPGLPPAPAGTRTKRS